jgi:hypothetical protein
MESLRAIIAPYVDDVTLGAREMQKLASRLRKLSRRNERYFWICLLLLGVVLLASLGFVIVFRNQPGAIAGVFAVMGASAYGGVRQMTELWREKVSTDVAFEVVEVLTEAQALKVLREVFFDRLTLKQPVAVAGVPVESGKR